jgi:hypothetical protein
VPEDFKGEYQVQVEIDLGPFERKLDDTWYTIG